MIQAAQINTIDPKALKSAEGKNPNELLELEGSLEAQDFANELQASLALDVQVAPVEVSAEQALELPTNLIKSEEQADSASPKVFDPSLTKDVENLIRPKLVDGTMPGVELQEVAEVDATELKAEIAQAMLKTPKVAAAQGRAPSIDFAQTEIDPQLMNMEDFVAQKNLVAKKSLPNAYGMKVLPEQQQKAILENGLKSTEVMKDITGVEGTGVNSQQFILNIMNEQQGTPTVNETQAAPKVFDMSNIKTTNTSEIINQITDYTMQAKTASEPTVNMRMKHDDLGLIDITVSKTGANHEAIAVNIGTHSAEGKSFFQQNSKELFTHLTNAGLNISDVKVETPTQLAKNDFDFGSQSGRNQQQGTDKQFGSEQNQRRHEQERRQELWNLFNKEAA